MDRRGELAAVRDAPPRRLSEHGLSRLIHFVFGSGSVVLQGAGGVIEMLCESTRRPYMLLPRVVV
jgi:hypothetical protein